MFIRSFTKSYKINIILFDYIYINKFISLFNLTNPKIFISKNLNNRIKHKLFLLVIYRFLIFQFSYLKISNFKVNFYDNLHINYSKFRITSNFLELNFLELELAFFIKDTIMLYIISINFYDSSSIFYFKKGNNLKRIA